MLQMIEFEKLLNVPYYIQSMNREHRNQLRKKIENYSYGLNDYLNLAKRSNIFKGVNEATSEVVAIKVVDLRNKELQASIKEQLGVEIDALKKLSHPNIVRCLDIYSTVNNCYIITEFCEGGDLQNRINTRGALKESQALSLFRDLIAGYSNIAHDKIIHGGLKPSSLLLKENVLKISGFANCRKINKPEVKKQVPFNSYQSPESVKEGIFNQKSDVWSIGMVLYAMLHGKQPWEVVGPAELLEAQLKPIPISSDFSEDIRQFLRLTLANKTGRLSVEEMLEHRFIKRIMSNHYTAEKYSVGLEGVDHKGKKERDSLQHQMNKVQKHITCQINWMRFLFRLMDKFGSMNEDRSTSVVKFVILRQLAVQNYNLKQHLEMGQNAFSFGHWEQFAKNKDKMAKYLEIFRKNQPRFEKANLAYLKLLEKLYLWHQSYRGLTQILNNNFALSEYNCIFALGASITEIKRLWQKIIKEYSPRQKHPIDPAFKFKNELLLIDFLTTYYQLNCLLIEDFQRLDYFQKMSKLQVILEYQPLELDGSHLQQVEAKLKQLGIL